MMDSLQVVEAAGAVVLVGLGWRFWLSSMRRREDRDQTRELAREKRDVARENRLISGLDNQATAIRDLCKRVDRQAAATLAASRADPARIDEILRRLTAGDSECAECPLATMSQSDIPAFLERLRQCRENHLHCYIYDAYAQGERTDGRQA